MAISPDAGHVAWVEPILDSRGESTGSTDIYLQDLKSPDAKPRRISASSSGGNADEGEIAWSPDSKRIASSSGPHEHQVHVWNALPGGSALVYRGHTDKVWSVAWAPEGKRIASTSEDHTVQVWWAA